MRITYIHQDGLITGSAISLYNLIKSVRKEGLEASVILLADGPAKEFFKELHVPIYVCNQGGFWTAPGPKWYQRGTFLNFRALRLNRELLKIVQQLSPAIIHINDKAAINAGLSCKKLGLPIVQHLRSSYFSTAFWLNKLISVSIIRSYAQALVSISEDEADGFEKDKRLVIVNNSVDMEMASKHFGNRTVIRKELNFSNEEIVLGYVGVISENRGAWDFLETASLLVNRNPTLSFVFLLIGAVPTRPGTLLGKKQADLDEAILKKWKAELGAKLRIVGYTKEPLRYMAALDLLIVTSRLGVLGRQPLESQSVGVPVVAYRGRSKHNSIVIDKQTGELVMPRHPLQLAAKIEGILKDRAMYERMRYNAREHAMKNFHPTANAKKIISIYLNLKTSKS